MRQRRREPASCRGVGDGGGGKFSPEAPWWKAGATARASESAGAGKGGARRGLPAARSGGSRNLRISASARAAAHSGSARAGRRYVGGNSPTSTRLLHQPEMVQKFPASGCIFPARPPVTLPPPPLEDITFIFQYVVNDTPGHSSESWVNTEEMFLGVRKGGVGCVRTGGNGGVGERRNYIISSKGQASVYLLACFVCLWLSPISVIISKIQ